MPLLHNNYFFPSKWVDKIFKLVKCLVGILGNKYFSDHPCQKPSRLLILHSKAPFLFSLLLSKCLIYFCTFLDYKYLKLQILGKQRSVKSGFLTVIFLFNWTLEEPLNSPRNIPPVQATVEQSGHLRFAISCQQ